MLFLALWAAQSHAQTTLPAGSKVYVFGDGDVKAQFLGGSAGFDNRLFLNDPANAFGEIFHNHSSPLFEVSILGSFLPGAELLFRNNVSDSVAGFPDYFTGPGSRNPDGLVHARIEMFTNDEVGVFEGSLGLTEFTLLRSSASNQVVFLIGFEDQFNNGDGDFDDMRFLVSNVTAVPEPSEAVLLLAGLGVIGLLIRRRRKV